MYLKMLKSELKTNKGLNAVLFVFIAISAVLMFVSAVQIFSFFLSNEATYQRCNMVDLCFIIESREYKIDARRKASENTFDEEGYIKDFERVDMLHFLVDQLDFDNIEEKSSSALDGKIIFLTDMPKKYDLLRDENDNAFEVPSGCIALPTSVKATEAVDVGDKVRVTTEMGNVYELTVCGFFKESISYSWLRRFVISDEDLAVLAKDCHYVSDLYQINVDKDKFLSSSSSGSDISDVLTEKLRENGIEPYQTIYQGLEDNSIMMLILSVFLTMISVFMILIILMTIRFTMIAALKEEEKEIGMLRAIGAESRGLRWLFITKYVGFSVVGGIIGVIAGPIVSRIVLKLFSPNTVMPSVAEMLLCGIPAVCLISGVMILFSLSVMRRINRISVIDAIHGENHGERFGSSEVMFLYKRRKMPVPLYLALSDIAKRFKRYLFLLIAYVLGVSIMLITVNLRNSVISERFLCYSQMYAFDFDIELDDPVLRKEMIKRAKREGVTIFHIIDEELKAAGLPVHFDFCNSASGIITIDEDPTDDITLGLNYSVLGNIKDLDCYTYREGGKPVKKNEIAMSYFTANKYGLKIGDTISVDIAEASIDDPKGEYVTHQMVITGFIDAVEDNGGMRFILLSPEYELPDTGSYEWLASRIDAPDSEKDEVVEQIKELFPGCTVRNGTEVARYQLAEYDSIFAMLEYVMGGTVIFITVLMTYLYLNIFIAEETREIALLKSLGFTDGSVRAWQLIRLMVLTGSAIIIAIIFVKTAGTVFIRKLFELVPLSGFSFLPEYLFSFGLIPLAAFMTVGITTLLRLTTIGRISVSRINEE